MISYSFVYSCKCWKPETLDDIPILVLAGIFLERMNCWRRKMSAFLQHKILGQFRLKQPQTLHVGLLRLSFLQNQLLDSSWATILPVLASMVSGLLRNYGFTHFLLAQCTDQKQEWCAEVRCIFVFDYHCAPSRLDCLLHFVIISYKIYAHIYIHFLLHILEPLYFLALPVFHYCLWKSWIFDISNTSLQVLEL